MKSLKKRIFCILLSLTLVFSGFGLAFAHSGRTDSAGGHRDNKNASGLGSYHYHHGYGPHLHSDGVCPYDAKPTSGESTVKKTSSNAADTNKAAQQKLKDLGYYDGEIDGSFGKQSKAALKAFQKDYGLTVDGSLGPKSKAALEI